MPDDRSRRGELVAVLVVYVLPLAAATGVLAAAGLGRLALALLAVEAVVVVAVVVAKRQPRAPVGTPTSRPWLVPVAMVGVLVLLGLGSALASTYG